MTVAPTTVCVRVLPGTVIVQDEVGAVTVEVVVVPGPAIVVVESAICTKDEQNAWACRAISSALAAATSSRCSSSLC